MKSRRYRYVWHGLYNFPRELPEIRIPTWYGRIISKKAKIRIGYGRSVPCGMSVTCSLQTVQYKLTFYSEVKASCENNIFRGEDNWWIHGPVLYCYCDQWACAFIWVGSAHTKPRTPSHIMYVRRENKLSKTATFGVLSISATDPN